MHKIIPDPPPRDLPESLDEDPLLPRDELLPLVLPLLPPRVDEDRSREDLAGSLGFAVGLAVGDFVAGRVGADGFSVGLEVGDLVAGRSGSFGSPSPSPNPILSTKSRRSPIDLQF